MKITKKIFNKILFAVVVALVFSFINRCSVKALDTPFVITGSLDFNIVTKNSDNEAVYMTQTRNYDFSLLLEEHENDFENYDYFFITFLNYDGNSWGTNNYVVELYFTNSISISTGSNTITGNLQRYVYDTNFNAKSNDIFGSNTLTTTRQLASGSRTGISVFSYYKRIPFYGIGSAYNNTYADSSVFTDSTNIPLLNHSYSSPNYFVPIGSAGSWARSLLFSNYTGNFYAYNSSGNLSAQSYESYIGDTTPPINYNIDFVTIISSDNSQEEYGNDMTITSVGTAIKYSPCDSELYNYYYDFIPSGDTQHVMDWKQVTDNKCIGSYNVKENGTLVGLITDKQDNQLYVKNYVISSVGTLSTFAVNNNKFSTFLTDISSNINYGGPISGLTTIPINLMSTLYNSFSGTCSAYNLGTILGHNVVINCFSLQSILGSSITDIIDMICAFGIYYHLVLLIISIYRKVMNLQELNDYLGTNEEYDLHE